MADVAPLEYARTCGYANLLRAQCGERAREGKAHGCMYSSHQGERRFMGLAYCASDARVYEMGR